MEQRGPHRRAGEPGGGAQNQDQNNTSVPSWLLGGWATQDFKASAQFLAGSQTPVTSLGQAF